MIAGIGRITARLADNNECTILNAAQQINERIQPLESVSADDIYVRAMYVVSDEVNSLGGRFPSDEHDHLIELLLDSPVLVGHRKDSLPVARTFHAESVERNGRKWVKSYFYWLKTADNANDLRENIDGGIYKECSISFTFQLPECSLCRRDIRLCEHRPFQSVSRDGNTEAVHFNYRRIERVLETSLVYRGAQRNTAISKDCIDSKASPELSGGASVQLANLSHLSELKQESEYLLVPHYDGLPVTLSMLQGYLVLRGGKGASFPVELAVPILESSLISFTGVRAVLVGYRGKERCANSDTSRHIIDGSGPVSRLILFIFPSGSDTQLPVENLKQSFDIRIIPYRIASAETLDRAGAEVMTRDGIEIWPWPHDSESRCAYRYTPRLRPKSQIDAYRLTLDSHENRARLFIRTDQLNRSFTIHGWNLELLRKGRWFPADQSTAVAEKLAATAPHDVIHLCEKTGKGYRLRLSGTLEGNYLLRPIILGKKERFLFSKISD